MCARRRATTDQGPASSRAGPLTIPEDALDQHRRWAERRIPEHARDQIRSELRRHRPDHHDPGVSSSLASGPRAWMDPVPDQAAALHEVPQPRVAVLARPHHRRHCSPPARPRRDRSSARQRPASTLRVAEARQAAHERTSPPRVRRTPHRSARDDRPPPGAAADAPSAPCTHAPHPASSGGIQTLPTPPSSRAPRDRVRAGAPRWDPPTTAAVPASSGERASGPWPPPTAR